MSSLSFFLNYAYRYFHSLIQKGPETCKNRPFWWVLKHCEDNNARSRALSLSIAHSLSQFVSLHILYCRNLILQERLTVTGLTAAFLLKKNEWRKRHADRKLNLVPNNLKIAQKKKRWNVRAKVNRRWLRSSPQFHKRIKKITMGKRERRWILRRKFTKIGKEERKLGKNFELLYQYNNKQKTVCLMKEGNGRKIWSTAVEDFERKENFKLKIFQKRKREKEMWREIQIAKNPENNHLRRIKCFIPPIRKRHSCLQYYTFYCMYVMIHL